MDALTSYDEILFHIFSRRATKCHDLSLMESFMAAFGHPQKIYPCIHVGGTNGKGQVASKIAKALQLEGFRVGLYTSPHLFDYTERICIDSYPISKEKIVSYYEEGRAVADQLQLPVNFFEMTTSFAFRHFAEENVDIAIFEVGVGGANDATNIVYPLVSTITSIGMDHLEFLGNSKEAIAMHKAGIIKPHVPVVLGPRAKYIPFFERASSLEAPLHILERESCFYDTENQMIARRVLELLPDTFRVSRQSMSDGLKTCLPCRFEKKGDTIYDVAHNREGFIRLADALEHLYPYKTFRFLIGLGAQKNADGCLRAIHQKAHFFHFVQADNQLGLSPSILAETLQGFSEIPFREELSVQEGMREAKSLLKSGEMLVVCGSFYIMDAAIHYA